MNEELKNIVINSTRELYKNDGIDFNSVDFLMEMKKEPEFGNYSSNIAFPLSKLLKRPSNEIAGEIKDNISKTNKAFIEKVEVAGGGFINFFLSKKYIADVFFGDNILKHIVGKGQNIIIEYSSPNVAKPMHVGHLRATVLGDFLANLHEFVGYNVTRWNHVGDWGTQFGKLIVAYKLWGNKDNIIKEPIKELLKLYIKFHKESEEDEDLIEDAREEFKKLENGDKENKKILRWFLDESMKEFNSIYKKLSINFDVVLGESNYIKLGKKIIDELNKFGISSKSEGAIVVDLEENNLGTALVEKADGSTLYLTRDLALISYRQKKYNPDKILYVVGDEQKLHLKQLGAIVNRLNNKLDDKNKLPEFEHVSFGFVLGPDGKKLSTRDGRVIQASDIINQSLDFVGSIINEKQKKLSTKEKNKIINAVGIGVVKYSMLKENRTSNIKLNLDVELSSKGNSSSYLQYTYARLSNIIKKSKKSRAYNYEHLEDVDMRLIQYAILLPKIFSMCLRDYSPHHLAEYMFELANKINSFYETTPILKDENLDRRNARLNMLIRFLEILRVGFDIMGIKVLEKI